MRGCVDGLGGKRLAQVFAYVIEDACALGIRVMCDGQVFHDVLSKYAG